jgi:hypothetical protein
MITVFQKSRYQSYHGTPVFWKLSLLSLKGRPFTDPPGIVKIFCLWSLIFWLFVLPSYNTITNTETNTIVPSRPNDYGISKLQSQGFKSLLFNNFANFRIFLNLHPDKLWNKKIKKQTNKEKLDNKSYGSYPNTNDICLHFLILPVSEV